MKKPKKMLHMHQIRDFIDNRYSFYQKYFNNVEPAFYNYKGMKKAFQVGSAVDYAIKTYYQNKNNGCDIENGIFESNEFKTLPTKLDQVIVLGLVNGYISKYNNEEYFHNFKIINYKVNLGNYIIYCSPDLVADSYIDNDLYIIEIKTSGDDDKKYSPETLDFQTMTYCWASYKWNFKVPKGVLKRTLMKPRIKQKKNETASEFRTRVIIDITDNPDKYYKVGYRPVNKEMIKDYEKYLKEILKELDRCTRYSYYKQSSDYWGL